MNKKVKLLIIVGILVQVVLSLVLVVSFPTIMHRLTNREVDTPAPKVTYCEFPFELTYMHDGETITIRDVYVCEYVGTYWNWNIGNYRQWNGYIKSTHAENIVLIKDENKELVCTVGSPDYYMGDHEDGVIYPDYPVLWLVEYLETGGERSSHVSDEMKEYYKIELISWELSEPIVNSFG